MAVRRSTGQRALLRRVAGPVLPALLRQRRRLLLAGIAVAVGVGYLAGTLGLLGRIGQGLDDLSQTSADRADLVVEGEIAYESTIEQVRRLVPATVVDIAERTEGVKSASHRLEDVAVVVDSEGSPVVDLGLSEQPLGQNWPEDPDVSPVDVQEGRPPENVGEVVIDRRSADAAGVGIGDEVTVAGRQVGTFEIVGLAEPPAGGINQGVSLTILNTEDARTIFDRPVDDNRVAVVVEEGEDPAEVAARLGPMLPMGVELVTGEEAAHHQAEALTRSFSLISTLVLAFGVLALAVGMLTVANSLGLLHSQRRQLFATFRTVGAKRRQLRWAATAEAALLALVASVVGLPLGLLIAWLIERSLGALGTAIPTSGPWLTPRSAGIALGVGLLTTIVAAWRPVSRASSVSPMEALHPHDEIEPRPNPFPMALSWAAVVGVGAAGVALLVAQPISSTLVLAVVAAAVTFFISILPWVLSRSVALIIRIAPFRPAPLRRVAARDVSRNPRRTASTTAAVLVATAVLTGLVGFLGSFTASLSSEVDGLVAADLVVDSGTFTRGGLPLGLIDELAAQPGVEAASGWQLTRGSVGEYAIRMTGLDGAAATEVVDPEWVGEPPSELGPLSTWLSDSLAGRLGVGLGDEVQMVFTSGGVETLSVDGIYSTGRGLLGDAVTDRDVQLRQVPATVDIAALVRTDGSQAAEDAVARVAADNGVDTVLSPSEFVDARSDLLRGFQSVIQWMLLFTFVQALIGVVNTLTMSVGERRREIGLLRISGATRPQVRRMVLFEGTALAIVGSVLGVALGVAMTFGAIALLSGTGINTVAIPWGVVGAIAVVAVVVGVISSLIPARMAAAIPPLDAINDAGAGTITRHAAEAEPEREAVVSRPFPPMPAPQPSVAQPSVAQPIPAQPSVAQPSVTGFPTPTPAYLGRSIPVLDVAGETALAATESVALAALMATRSPSVDQHYQGAEEPAAAKPAEAATTAPPLSPPAVDAFTGLVTPRPSETVANEPRVEGGGHRDEPTPDEPTADEIAAAREAAAREAAVREAQEAAAQVDAAREAAAREAAAQEAAARLAAAQGAEASEKAEVLEAEFLEDDLQAAPGEVFAEDADDVIEAQEVVPEPAEPATAGFEAVSPEAAPSESQDAARERSGSRRDRIKHSAGRRPRRKARDSAATSEGWVSARPPEPADPIGGLFSGPTEAVVARPAPEEIREESLAVAIRRLTPSSASSVSTAISLAKGHLAEDETVKVGVAGRVRGWPTFVVLTDRRILLIVERERPMVTSLYPAVTELTLQDRFQPSEMHIVDRGRELVVDGIVDTHLAREMCEAERVRN